MGIRRTFGRPSGSASFVRHILISLPSAIICVTCHCTTSFHSSFCCIFIFDLILTHSSATFSAFVPHSCVVDRCLYGAFCRHSFCYLDLHCTTSFPRPRACISFLRFHFLPVPRLVLVVCTSRRSRTLISSAFYLLNCFAILFIIFFSFSRASFAVRLVCFLYFALFILLRHFRLCVHFACVCIVSVSFCFHLPHFALRYTSSFSSASATSSPHFITAFLFIVCSAFRGCLDPRRRCISCLFILHFAPGHFLVAPALTLEHLSLRFASSRALTLHVFISGGLVIDQVRFVCTSLRCVFDLTRSLWSHLASSFSSLSYLERRALLHFPRFACICTSFSSFSVSSASRVSRPLFPSCDLSSTSASAFSRSLEGCIIEHWNELSFRHISHVFCTSSYSFVHSSIVFCRSSSPLRTSCVVSILCTLRAICCSPRAIRAVAISFVFSLRSRVSGGALLVFCAFSFSVFTAAGIDPLRVAAPHSLQGTLGLDRCVLLVVTSSISVLRFPHLICTSFSASFARASFTHFGRPRALVSAPLVLRLFLPRPRCISSSRSLIFVRPLFALHSAPLVRYLVISFRFLVSFRFTCDHLRLFFWALRSTSFLHVILRHVHFATSSGGTRASLLVFIFSSNIFHLCDIARLVQAGHFPRTHLMHFSLFTVTGCFTHTTSASFSSPPLVFLCVYVASAARSSFCAAVVSLPRKLCVSFVLHLRLAF